MNVAYTQLVSLHRRCLVYLYVGALFCTITGNQQQRRYDPDLMIQIEDLMDRIYRPKEGAIPAIEEIVMEVHAPFVQLRHMRPEEKAMLSLPASSNVPTTNII